MDHPFSRLLLATECGDFDIGAERVALDMAARCGLPLMAVLPVVSNPEYEMVAPQLVARAEHEAADKLQALGERARAAGVTLDARVRRGEEPWIEIVNEATERAADLVICRRRGKRGFLANLLVGEMVSKVVGRAPCSALMVPRNGAMWSRRILLATDGAPDAAYATQVAGAIAELCRLPVSVVSVGADMQAYVDVAVAQLRNAGVQTSGRICSGKPHEAILAVARDEGADLLVIGRSGEGGDPRRLLGGTAERVVGQADGPVLVVHRPQADGAS